MYSESYISYSEADVSFREKIAWSSLLSMALVYGTYVGLRLSSPPGTDHTGLLVASVIALIVVQATLAIVIAVTAPQDAKAPRDERDRLIELNAMRVAYSGLATGVACAALFGVFGLAFDAGALLFVLACAEMLRAACQIVQYRRGS